MWSGSSAPLLSVMQPAGGLDEKPAPDDLGSWGGLQCSSSTANNQCGPALSLTATKHLPIVVSGTTHCSSCPLFLTRVESLFASHVYADWHMLACWLVFRVFFVMTSVGKAPLFRPLLCGLRQNARLSQIPRIFLVFFYSFFFLFVFLDGSPSCQQMTVKKT